MPLEPSIALIEIVRQDPGIALTSLITTAVHDNAPRRPLKDIVEAVKNSQCASALVRYPYADIMGSC